MIGTHKNLIANLIFFIDMEANFEMPCKAGGIGTIVPGLFKAKAGNLLLNWG